MADANGKEESVSQANVVQQLHDAEQANVAGKQGVQDLDGENDVSLSRVDKGKGKARAIEPEQDEDGEEEEDDDDDDEDDDDEEDEDDEEEDDEEADDLMNEVDLEEILPYSRQRSARSRPIDYSSAEAMQKAGLDKASSKEEGAGQATSALDNAEEDDEDFQGEDDTMED